MNSNYTRAQLFKSKDVASKEMLKFRITVGKKHAIFAKINEEILH